MATVTDPASELADIAERLTKGSNAAGEIFLAQEFGVEPWSTEFVKIIACIHERADLVKQIVQRSSMDDKHKTNALSDIAKFKSGFSGGSFRNHWNNSGHGLSAMKDHGRPLQYLAQTVRAEIAYPQLDEREIEELILLVDAYLAELAQSDEGPAFVRQAITDGLASFKFQLKHIGWMGSGYALSAFREVMFVYEASKRHFPESGQPDAEAVLKGLFDIIKYVKTRIDAAKGWSDTAGTVWKTYQVASTAVPPLLLTWNILQ